VTIRLCILGLCAARFFGVLLPNAGSFPELASTPDEAEAAVRARFLAVVIYAVGYAVAAGGILVEWKRRSRWELVGWLALAVLALLPVL
jgi:hypothetical protein